MYNNHSYKIKAFEFVIKILEEISKKRENQLFIDRCKSIRNELKTLQNKRDYLAFQIDLFQMIDELKFIIQAEIRFFLFPLPNIKKETFELGKKYMDNFLKWYKPEKEIAVEDILKFLNDEIYLLEEVKNILNKLRIN